MRAFSSRQLKGGKETWKDKRDLILSILKSTTTKREAREYLARYKTDLLNETSANSPTAYLEGGHNKVNSFVPQYLKNGCSIGKMLNVQLKQVVLFRIPSRLLSSSLQMISEGLKTIKRLGVSPILFLGDSEGLFSVPKLKMSSLRSKALEMASIMSCSEDHKSLYFTPLVTPLEICQQKISFTNSNDLLIPLHQGNIPIVLPVAFDMIDGKHQVVSTQKGMLAVIETLLESESANIQKIVFVDSRGGIPSIERGRTSHVFINNSQEYSDIVSELHIGFLDPDVRDVHLANLSNMRELLLACKSSAQKNEATGIVLRPDNLSLQQDMLNPVAYNILTDRPMISSSLPPGRSRTPQTSTSIIKNGFNVQLYYPRDPTRKFDSLMNKDQIDKAKLLLMIDDSFGKCLKRTEYVERLNRSLDCIILIGDYDGGAVITKEELENGCKIPYLDKFAITKRNQGLPSLADVIFKLILQAYQEEIIWRSRNVNPVNKWYFERCNGSFHESGSAWKLFFAGDVFNRKISREIRGKIAIYWKHIQSIPSSFS